MSKYQSVFLPFDALCIPQWCNSLPEKYEKRVQSEAKLTDMEKDFLVQNPVIKTKNFHSENYNI